MRKTVMMLAAVLVLMLAACTSANEDTTDNKQNGSSQNEDTSQGKQADQEQQGSGNEEQTAADFNVKVEDKTIKFKEANLPVAFNITKNGKPYTGVTLGLQVVNRAGFIPFTAEEIENGRYEGKIRVAKPGEYKINVFRMEGQKIIVLDSFKLKIS